VSDVAVVARVSPRFRPDEQPKRSWIDKEMAIGNAFRRVRDGGHRHQMPHLEWHVAPSLFLQRAKQSHRLAVREFYV
jgi:hypothetical protein